MPLNNCEREVERQGSIDRSGTQCVTALHMLEHFVTRCHWLRYTLRSGATLWWSLKLPFQNVPLT